MPLAACHPCPFAGAQRLPATRVGRRLGIPVVHEMRASWEDAAVDHGTTTEGSLRYRLSRWLETQALRRADQVTTICEGLRSDIVGRGISPAKVTVIPNAVDVNAFEYDVPPDEALRNSLGLRGATVLGFAGSFYGYEGLDMVVAAMPRLLETFPELRALFVGGGPQESALKAQVASLGLGDRVIFTGRVPHSEVHRYYNLIDVLVSPAQVDASDRPGNTAQSRSRPWRRDVCWLPRTWAATANSFAMAKQAFVRGRQCRGAWAQRHRNAHAP